MRHKPYPILSIHLALLYDRLNAFPVDTAKIVLLCEDLFINLLVTDCQLYLDVYYRRYRTSELITHISEFSSYIHGEYCGHSLCSKFPEDIVK